MALATLLGKQRLDLGLEHGHRMVAAGSGIRFPATNCRGDDGCDQQHRKGKAASHQRDNRWEGGRARTEGEPSGGRDRSNRRLYCPRTPDANRKRFLTAHLSVSLSPTKANENDNSQVILRMIRWSLPA